MISWNDMFGEHSAPCLRCGTMTKIMQASRPGGFEGPWMYLHKCDNCGHEVWRNECKC